MDETINIFKTYFRDIYSASSKTCAGACDEATPSSLGPLAYDLRQCCKSACSDTAAFITSEDSCANDFCVKACRDINSTECMRICTVGCHKRFTA